MQTEAHYMVFQALEKEIKESQYKSLDLTIKMIEEKMPLTSRYIRVIQEEEYNLSWEEFIQNPGMLRTAVTKIAERVKVKLASNKKIILVFFYRVN